MDAESKQEIPSWGHGMGSPADDQHCLKDKARRELEIRARLTQLGRRWSAIGGSCGSWDALMENQRATLGRGWSRQLFPAGLAHTRIRKPPGSRARRLRTGTPEAKQQEGLVATGQSHKTNLLG